MPSITTDENISAPKWTVLHLEWAQHQENQNTRTKMTPWIDNRRALGKTENISYLQQPKIWFVYFIQI